MIVTKNTTIVLIIAVLCSKDRGTNGACEVLDVVFSFQGGNIRASESTTACIT